MYLTKIEMSACEEIRIGTKMSICVELNKLSENDLNQLFENDLVG